MDWTVGKLNPLLMQIPHKEAEMMIENLEKEFSEVPLAPVHAKMNRALVQRLRDLLEYYNE